MEDTWALERSPIFFRILRTWLATVCSEIDSSKAIQRLVSPRATRSATSCSRAVSLSVGSSCGGFCSGTASSVGALCSSSERAYLTACSSVIARPSYQAAWNSASSSRERAASKKGSSTLLSSGGWEKSEASRRTSAAPHSRAALPTYPCCPHTAARASRDQVTSW